MNIRLYDKSVEIRLTPAAERALAARSAPLIVEMELLFSCLLRKRVHFGEPDTDDTPVSDLLAVRFRPIMTRRCPVSGTDGPPPSDRFPIAHPRPFVPNWLDIDYRRGAWHGNFGYAE